MVCTLEWGHQSPTTLWTHWRSSFSFCNIWCMLRSNATNALTVPWIKVCHWHTYSALNRHSKVVAKGRKKWWSVRDKRQERPWRVEDRVVDQASWPSLLFFFFVFFMFLVVVHVYMYARLSPPWETDERATAIHFIVIVHWQIHITQQTQETPFIELFSDLSVSFFFVPSFLSSSLSLLLTTFLFFAGAVNG